MDKDGRVKIGYIDSTGLICLTHLAITYEVAGFGVQEDDYMHTVILFEFESNS
jgi:hypothetical protein